MGVEHVCVSVCMTASHPRNVQLNVLLGNFSGVGVRVWSSLFFYSEADFCLFLHFEHYKCSCDLKKIWDYLAMILRYKN